MNRTTTLVTAIASLASFTLSVGCGSSPPPPSPPPPTTVIPEPASSAAPAATTATKPAEPTAEEKKKAEEQKQLQEDRAQMEEAHKKDMERWTPELHAFAKSLADKDYPNSRAALQAAISSKTRSPGHAERDKYRHPLETLEFFGFKPTMTVFEYGPGEGWYTELLAPSLAKKGKLIVNTTDPNGPIDQRSTYYAQRLKLFLETSPELYGKVQAVVLDSKTPPAPSALGADGKVDLALLIRGMHGMVNNDRLEPWLAAVHQSLKPNGILGIEQHRAKPDADPKESAKKGYLPEKWVIERVEAAGFKLAGKSEVNANAKDTKDYPGGVWTLPPTLAQKDKDRDKYIAIGESDRMTLKFVKVEKKK